MLRVLGKASSINVRKVLWACDEIGLAYIREDWGSGYRSTSSAEFQALNPSAMVPVLVDGDIVLWESNVIVRYLAAKHERHDLLPVTAAERAQVEMWMDWQASDFNNSWRYAFQALVRKNPACQGVAELAASVKDWTRNIAIIEAQLGKTGSYIASAGFTVADVAIGLAVNRWFMTPLAHPPFAAVAAYFERLSERPAFRLHGRNGTP